MAYKNIYQRLLFPLEKKPQLKQLMQEITDAQNDDKDARPR